MLKIKDDVDLKELEKYGFKYSSGEDWHNYSIDDFDFDLGDNKELNINFADCYYDESIKGFVNFLYDLIKDGLVEKVKK